MNISITDNRLKATLYLQGVQAKTAGMAGMENQESLDYKEKEAKEANLEEMVTAWEELKENLEMVA